MYDGHSGAQVIEYRQDRLHTPLAEELCAIEDRVSASDDELSRLQEAVGEDVIGLIGLFLPCRR